MAGTFYVDIDKQLVIQAQGIVAMRIAASGIFSDKNAFCREKSIIQTNLPKHIVKGMALFCQSFA